MHDNSSGRPEPSLEWRDSRQFVAFFDLNVGSSLQQVLLHIVHEVVEEFHLFLQHWRVLVQRVVVLRAFEVDVMDVAENEERKWVHFNGSRSEGRIQNTEYGLNKGTKLCNILLVLSKNIMVAVQIIEKVKII